MFIINNTDGMYSSLIGTDIVPEGHIEVPMRPSPDYVYVNGSWSLPIVTAQNIAIERVRAAYGNTINNITLPYTTAETSTWTKQESEARAYQVNNAAPAPLITALATNRGIAIAELVTRIIAKADAYATAVGQLLGVQQKQEDAIAAATTLDELNAILTALQLEVFVIENTVIPVVDAVPNNTMNDSATSASTVNPIMDSATSSTSVGA